MVSPQCQVSHTQQLRRQPRTEGHTYEEEGAPSTTRSGQPLLPRTSQPMEGKRIHTPTYRRSDTRKFTFSPPFRRHTATPFPHNRAAVTCMHLDLTTQTNGACSPCLERCILQVMLTVSCYAILSWSMAFSFSFCNVTLCKSFQTSDCGRICGQSNDDSDYSGPDFMCVTASG